MNATLLSAKTDLSPRILAELEWERRPLLLTEADAKLLLELCAASPATGGQREARLFASLGELLREFPQAEGA